MRGTRPLIATVAAAAVLVVGADYATFAATGGSFILGRGNTAGKTTTLKNNGKGATLNLQTSAASRPPLATNSKTRVTNLNADLVDGKNAADLGVRTRLYTWSGTRSEDSYFMVGSVPAGSYLVSYTANAGIEAGATTDISCWISIPSRDLEVAKSRQDDTPYVALSSTAVVDVKANDDVLLACDSSNSAADYTFAGDNPLQLTFTRIASITRETMTSP